jgi:ABC-2 type transport system permease protein
MRLLWRRLRGKGGTAELLARIALYGIAVPLALVFAGLAGAGSWQAARAGGGLLLEVQVTALFFGIWQTWTAVGLSLAEREGLDLRRFLVYPLPPGRVWAYGFAASVVGDPFAVFWCVILAGSFAGAALGRPGPWLLLLAATLVAFVAATAAVVALVQELLVRLLRGRRARELAIAAVYLATAAGLAWLSAGGRTPFQTLRILARARWVAFPAALGAAAARRLYAGDSLAALPWLAGLAAAAGGASWVAYRLALASALSGGQGNRASGGSGRGWRTGWLPRATGTLLEKEVKYVLRHPLASVLALVVPAFAAFVTWKASPRIPAEAGEVVRALPLFGFALYTHVVTQVFWLNAFGWERGGARLYFLAPVAPADVLAAKNAAVYALALAIFLACAGVGIAVGGPPPAWAVLAGFSLHAGMAPFVLAAGNVVSILNPRAAPMALQRGGALSQLSALLGMAIVACATGLFAVPVLAAIRLEAPWMLAAAWTALGIGGLALWRWVLPRAGALMIRRREALLAAVTGDED